MIEVMLAMIAISALLVTAAADTKVEDARKAFDEGVALLDDARYAEAATALERSIDAKETASARYNLALAYRGLGRYREAITQLQRYLAVAAASNADQRQAATNMLAELESSMGKLVIVVKGKPSQLRLDGEPLAFTGERITVAVDPGPHVVEAVQPGYRPARVAVAALAPGARGIAHIDATAEPLPAIVEVIAADERAAIRVDGTVRGLGRARVELPPGRHTFETEGGERRELDLAPGSEARVTLESESSVIDRWWFWAGAGAIAVAAVTGAVVVATSGGADYEGGSLGFTLRNLGSR